MFFILRVFELSVFETFFNFFYFYSDAFIDYCLDVLDILFSVFYSRFIYFGTHVFYVFIVYLYLFSYFNELCYTFLVVFYFSFGIGSPVGVGAADYFTFDEVFYFFFLASFFSLSNSSKNS